jgi:ribonuclease BN (tRNA processing enzyme)
VIHAPKPPRGIAQALGAGGHGGMETVLVVAQPGDRVDLPGAAVTAIAADHVGEALAWQFAEAGEAGRRIVFSGDTRPSAVIGAAARGADLLVHEATFTTARGDWAQRIGHTTAAAAGSLAIAAGVGALAVTHVSARERREAIATEVEGGYPGAIVATDLDLIEVGDVSWLVRRRALAGGHAGWARIRRSSLAYPELS